VERIGPYEVVRELGRGGMGVVFHARHAELGSDVALKVILAGPDGASANAIARFETEAQAAGRLSGHPNIAAVTDFGRHDGNLYLAMEFVEGTPLDVLIDQGELSREAAARAVAHTARALHHAHGAGVLHRDVKPANVLIRADGTAKLADFGLARQQAADADVTRLTQSGELLGTPAYMPPEQAKGQGVDARADVYSAGATLYACLTGVPPFQGDSVFAVIAGVMRNEPEPPRALDPSVPPALEAIALKCLEKDPAERYATAAELADDLERWLAGEAVTARERTSLEEAARSLKRHRNPVLIGAGVVAAAALLGAGAWQLSRGTESEAAKLKRETAALTEAERAGRVSATWQQLQRDSGAAMQRLEDRSGGAAVNDAEAAQALQAVRDAAAAARAAAPEVQAIAAWEALALQFAGRPEEAGRLLDAAVAAADPAIDPMPRVVRVRIALHHAAATLDPPTVDVGSSSVELGEWELGEAMTAALQAADAGLAPIPDSAWERLPAAQDDRAFAAGARAVAEGAWAQAESALTPLRDVPAFAAAAGMLGGVAALRATRYDAAAGWWTLAAERGWPRASALCGIAHMAHAITLHTSGQDADPALEAARMRLEAAIPGLPDPERALTDLGWTHLLRGTWLVNTGRDGNAPLERVWTT
jgi:predicted Ser/Thr protein kinase